MRVSGVEEIDRELDKQEIVTEMCIDRMFEKHRMGVTIRVLNYDDTAIIYNLIHAHLIAWAEYLATGVNVGGAPLKDLVELDAFAAVVYDKAKSVFSMEERVSALSSNFSKVSQFNFTNILKRSKFPEASLTKTLSSGAEVTQASKTVGEEPKFPERSSLKDIFATELSRVEGWRGRTDGTEK